MNTSTFRVKFILFLIAFGLLFPEKLYLPLLRYVGPNSAEIICRKNHTLNKNILLTWGETSACKNKVLLETQKTQVVILSNLKAGTSYYYTFKDEAGAVDEHSTFKTAPKSAKGFVFSVIGDTCSGNAIADIFHHKNIKAIQTYSSPRLLIHTGDLVYLPGPENWHKFFSIESKLSGSIPLLPVMGNRDPPTPQFQNNFPQLGEQGYYSYKYGNGLFIFLNIRGDRKGIQKHLLNKNSVQHQWLTKLLKENRKEDNRFKIVFFHHSVFPLNDMPYKELNNFLCPLFAENGVDLVVNAGHYYSSVLYRNTWYIVSGGGGGELAFNNDAAADFNNYMAAFHHLRCLVSENHLKIEVISEKGAILDSITISRLSAGGVPYQKEHKFAQENIAERGSGSKNFFLIVIVAVLASVCTALYFKVRKTG
jgi:predicted MPP superfamily phosphohydrolase